MQAHACVSYDTPCHYAVFSRGERQERILSELLMEGDYHAALKGPVEAADHLGDNFAIPGR